MMVRYIIVLVVFLLYGCSDVPLADVRINDVLKITQDEPRGKVFTVWVQSKSGEVNPSIVECDNPATIILDLKDNEIPWLLETNVRKLGMDGYEIHVGNVYIHLHDMGQLSGGSFVDKHGEHKIIPIN